MSGIFSKPSMPDAPPPPAAPVEEATFKAGGEDEAGRKELKNKAQGKKRLQVPLTTSTSSGLSIPS